MTSLITILLFMFVVGAVFGSFLNVLIFRIPKEISISFPPSSCPSCATQLKWYHNIPIFSYLFLRGKCGFCKEKISMRYPIIETISGLILVILFLQLGLVWYLPFVFFSFISLLTLVMIDFDHMAVPDNVNVAALIFALIQPDFVMASIYAGSAMVVLFTMSFIASKLAGKASMGAGDIIVAGTMGALLGSPFVFVAFFLSALLAIPPLLINRTQAIPFVPFLALATFIVYIYRPEIYGLILGFFY